MYKLASDQLSLTTLTFPPFRAAEPVLTQTRTLNAITPSAVRGVLSSSVTTNGSASRSLETGSGVYSLGSTMIVAPDASTRV